MPERLEQLLRVLDEGNQWDFKQTIELSSSKGRAELARDVMAFANSGGGRLINGVVDKTFEPVGIPADLELDTTTIHNAIEKYIDSAVETPTAAYWLDRPGWGSSRRFGISYIAPSFSVPVRAACDSPVFRKGDIFVRRGTQSCKATSSELEQLIRSTVIQAKQPFLTFTRISDTLLQEVKPYEVSIANIGDGIAVSCRYWGGDYSERYGGSEEGVSGYVTSYLQHFEATVVSLPHDGQERRYTAQPTWPQAAVPGLADLNASYE